MLADLVTLVEHHPTISLVATLIFIAAVGGTIRYHKSLWKTGVKLWCFIVLITLPFRFVVSGAVSTWRQRESLLQRICARQIAEAAQQGARLRSGHIEIAIYQLIRDAEMQKGQAVLLDDGKVLRDGVYSGSDPYPEVTLARKRIVSAMEARIGALNDILSFVKGEKDMPSGRSDTMWQYSDGGNPAYGVLERVDKNWEFDRNVYFPANKEDSAMERAWRRQQRRDI